MDKYRETEAGEQVYHKQIPTLYWLLSGTKKMRFAWLFIQRYHPAYIPLSEQPLLEHRHVVLCTHDESYKEPQFPDRKKRQRK